MAATKFTPGPWSTSELHVNDPKVCGGRVPCIEIGSESNPHASWIALVMEHQFPNDTAIGHANARLIAAAPEMFEALSVMERVVTELYPGAVEPDDAHIDEYKAVWSAVMSARAALAKAVR